MGRHEVYQRYVTKSLVVKIKEDRELYKKLKNEGKKVYCALSFIIKEPKVEGIISKYSYVFEEEVEVNDINAFIKSFLEDPKFRNENSKLVEGDSCLEVFDFTNSEGTNIECFNQITKLNHQKDVTKQDLMVLRTNGIDKYSMMNLDFIEEFIDSPIMQYFHRELKIKPHILKACRWYMRGLKKELCVKKVKIDFELNKEKQ